MNNPSFANSKEFLHYSFDTASNLKKCPVNALRNAMAKASHFKDSRAYCAALDSQKHPVATNETILKLYKPLADIGSEIAYSLFHDSSFADFPEEDLVEDGAIMIAESITTKELVPFATGEIGEDLIDMSKGDDGVLANMVWAELLSWATRVSIEEMDKEATGHFEQPAKECAHQDDVEDYLYQVHELITARVTVKIMERLMKGHSLAELYYTDGLTEPSVESSEGAGGETTMYDKYTSSELTQAEYDIAYKLYEKGALKANMPIEIKSGKSLAKLEPAELAVLLNYAMKEGFVPSRVSDEDVRFVDYYEQRVTKTQFFTALKMYHLYCQSKGLEPEVDAGCDFQSLSETEISHVIYHAELAGYHLPKA